MFKEGQQVKVKGTKKMGIITQIINENKDAENNLLIEVMHLDMNDPDKLTKEFYNEDNLMLWVK